jgi:Yip1 domain
MSTLTSRLLGSARLDSQSYEEIETDPYANVQALAVVLLSSLAAAIGTGIRDMGSTLQLVLVALASWIVWVLLTLFIGTKLLPDRDTKADFSQLLRTTGFSASPGILRVFGIIPGIGWLIFSAATVWMLFTFVVAVRQALDYRSTGRALAVCLLGWIIHGMVFFGFVKTAL